ncbi:MAG: c-type cytochrome [Parvibaculaceae bacterium]
MTSLVKIITTLALTLSFSGAALADEYTGDATQGEKVFKKCQACHTVEEGGPNRVGPNLYGILTRGVAKHEGYSYSAGMKAFGATGATWDEATLFKYLEKPKALVPTTNMSFPGLKKPEDRKNLLAYLEQASGYKK